MLPDDLKKRIQHPTSGIPIKQLVAQEQHPLSELPMFLSKKYTLDVPVYTVWGACEDVRVLEKFRSREYQVNNLHIIDEASSRLLDVGGVKLRLLGLGGAVVMHKLFDNGEGRTTIAGGQGTMWTTLLQMGELVDTANRVYDPTETRIFITHASPAREGLLNQLSVTLKADFSISAGLHFRYGSSYNEFSVNPTLDHYRGKLASSKASFNDVWETVKGEVMPAVQQNEAQNTLLHNALAFVEKMPTTANGGNPFGGPAASQNPGAGQIDESAFKNMWNFNLADAAFGYLVLEIEGGRIGTEMRAQGFNFSHRGGKHAPQHPAQQSTGPAIPQQPNVHVPCGPAGQTSASTPISPAVPVMPPSGPGSMRNKAVQQRPTPPPTGPKGASPKAAPAEPSLPLKPATPVPPTGPANRGATPVVSSPEQKTSNGTFSAVPAVPKIDTPGATGPTSTTPTPNTPQQENLSPKDKDRPQKHGIYVTGPTSKEAAREVVPEADREQIKDVVERTAKGSRKSYFLIYFETDEITKGVLDRVPSDYKDGKQNEHREVPFVKIMQDYGPSSFERGGSSSGSRPGMDASKWNRGQSVGGNTSESDGPSGYRRGSYRGISRGRGGFENTRGGGRGGRGGSRRGGRGEGGDGGAPPTAE